MIVATTLAENKYFLGLAALINSIVERGKYIDKIVVGYRHELPKWLPELHQSKNGKTCILNSGIELELVEMKGDLHMVHEKPKWFRYFTEVLEPDAEEYFFFDSDIVIVNRMSFFGEWVKQGVAICEDVNNSMNRNHPIRKQWSRFAQESGYEVNSQIDWYYNSGFIGWTTQTKSFLKEWETCFEILAKRSGDMKQFRVNDRTYPVLSANQDSLNLAAMITSLPVSTIGPEAMGFKNGMHLMSHPIGSKPWNRKYILEFLTGLQPRASDAAFWSSVNGSEFTPMNKVTVAYKRFICKFLRGLSRVYRKNDTT